MPREASGSVRLLGGVWVARIRTRPNHQESFRLPAFKVDDKDGADARAVLLSRVATRFRLAHVPEKDASEALHEIAGASEKALKVKLMYAEELLGGDLEDVGAEKALTFRQVGEKWTKGELHTEFPDHVEDIDQTENAKRLEKQIYPVIGPTSVKALSRADCDEVMRKLPEGLSRATRRHYAGLMHRVLNLAELAGYIQRNPLPRGWLPKLGAKKRFPILYPSEDRALLSCEEIPLAYRMLYGFLHREGVRRGEAAALRWKALDLENETISVDENKTDHARSWKLAPGVAKTLERWSEIRGGVEPDDRVFIDEFGRPLNVTHLAETLRAHIEKAGLVRTDLTSRGPNKGWFGVHCFRRSFVTRSLAIGKNEDWVRQRTGHKSEELLTYRQAAKGLAELDLHELDPLVLGTPIEPGLSREVIAPVAELADAQDSGSCARKGVSVRPRPGALK